jgi:hypothetical protein
MNNLIEILVAFGGSVKIARVPRMCRVQIGRHGFSGGL